VPTAALVTGPTAGLGLAFAHQLAAQGTDLVLVARDLPRLEQLGIELTATHGVRIEVIRADLADRADLAHVEARLRDGSAPIDMLVNNAGFGIRKRFGRSELESEQQLVEVLVTAVMRLSHAAIPGMTERGRGSIINVSSIASWVTGGSYSAAKAWCTVFSEGLATELAGTGIAVTAVCPGFIRTEFHQRAAMDMTQIPAWMWLEAQEVAAQALRDNARGKVLSVAGPQYKAMSSLLRVLPRRMVRRISAQRRR
jgi:uncharacterized protein